VRFSEVGPRKGNDPADIGAMLLKLADSPDPPLRTGLGRPLQVVHAAYEKRRAKREEWPGNWTAEASLGDACNHVLRARSSLC